MASEGLPENTSAAHRRLRLTFDLAFWRQQEQVEQGRALDGKLGQTVGFNAAMVALFGTAVLLISAADLSTIGVFMVIAAALFIANAVVSTVAFVIGRWTLSPSLEELRRYAQHESEDEMLRWVIDEILQAVRANERVLRIKETLVALAITLTATTAVVIAVAAIRVAL